MAEVMSETGRNSAVTRNRYPQPDALFLEYAQTGDRAVRERIVEQYVPLVNYLAFKFADRGEPLEDLRQIAFIGLLKAIEQFNPEVGARFASYACPTIIGEMKRYMRDRRGLIRLPRRLFELRVGVNRMTEQLASDMGRPPLPSEIAEKLKIPVEDVLEVNELRYYSDPRSLDAPAVHMENGALDSVRESLGMPDPGYEESEHKITLGAAMRGLTALERQTIQLSFYDGCTQREIASRIGKSQMHVSRVLRHALDVMKAAL